MRSNNTLLADFLSVEGKEKTVFFKQFGIATSNKSIEDKASGIEKYDLSKLTEKQLKSLKRMKFNNKDFKQRVEKALITKAGAKETKAKEEKVTREATRPTEPR